MRHLLGLSEMELRKRNRDVPVAFEPNTLINGHALICGMSGTGKSFQSLRMLDAASRQRIEIDVFDVHDELDQFAAATPVRYSQATGYGYNPLVLDTDAHVGGVDRQTQMLVDLIKDVGVLGVKQEACLRNLIIDTYAAAGIFADNPRSWHRKEINEAARKAMIEQRRYQDLRAFYPTLNDLMSFGGRKIQTLMIGGDNKAAGLLDQLQKLQKKQSRLNSKFARSIDEFEKREIEEKIKAVSMECVEAYSAFVDSLETGRELEDVLKYDSVEVLNGVLSRINLLNSAGIFSANPPPFGDSHARVHQIKSLTTEQQVLFVKLRLRHIFDQAKKRGPLRPGESIRHVIFLDEAHKYFRDDADDIVNVIAKEARKFGIALWCASQQPTEFPESFITNCGATFLLGLHASFWSRSCRMLRITEEQLRTIRPKEVIAAKFQREGEPDPPFVNIVVPNSRDANGRRAAQAVSMRPAVTSAPRPAAMARHV